VKAHATRNLTLNLPEPLLRRLRIYAAKHDQSMTQLITTAIQRMLAEDSWETSRRRLVERMAKAKGRGTNGVIMWTRDEIHER
jgi:plasmid stability protein